MILGNTLWSQSSSVCPATTFTLQDVDMSAVADPTLFSIVGSNVRVDTSDFGKIRLYNLKLKGTVPGYSATNEINF